MSDDFSQIMSNITFAHTAQGISDNEFFDFQNVTFNSTAWSFYVNSVSSDRLNGNRLIIPFTGRIVFHNETNFQIIYNEEFNLKVNYNIYSYY
jgi:hypothetical protein